MWQQSCARWISDTGLSSHQVFQFHQRIQHHCDSGDFICDCAVNVMSACCLKSLVGELVQDKSLKENIYNGDISAAESL